MEDQCLATFEEFRVQGVDLDLPLSLAPWIAELVTSAWKVEIREVSEVDHRAWANACEAQIRHIQESREVRLCFRARLGWQTGPQKQMFADSPLVLRIRKETGVYPCESIPPLQGSKSPKSGKEGFGVKKLPFASAPQVGASSQKIPIFLVEPCREMGILWLEASISGALGNGSFLTPKPLFSQFWRLRPLYGADAFAGLPPPLGRGVCQTKSKKGAPDTERPSCIGFAVIRGGLRPWSRKWMGPDHGVGVDPSLLNLSGRKNR